MRFTSFLLGFLYFALPVLTQGYDDEGDYYDYGPEESIEEPPKFLSTSQMFSVQVGDEITFPCDVDRRKNISHQLLFKFHSPHKPDRTIFVGNLKVMSRSRIIKRGDSFIIPQVRKSDAGEYICRFETSPVTQLSHRLNVQYPAKVSRVTDELQTVTQGSSVSLECEARGNPTPAITWSKRNGHLPSGAQSEEGLSIRFEEVDRHVEGTYICTASNGIGEPSSTHVTVKVEYKPEIVPEQIIVSTQNSYQAVLSCIVHGRPKPRVMWQRGDSPVSSEKHLMTHDGETRHSLTIFKVTEDDFGYYTCIAQNKLGKVQSDLYLTGLPKQPEITSSPKGSEEDSYTLKWTTETFAPIIQYRLKYRKVGDRQPGDGPQAWVTDKLYPTQSPPVEGREKLRIGRGVIEMYHPLEGLEPELNYEAVVGVENKFGWSSDSEVFQFFTGKEEEEIVPPKILSGSMTCGPSLGLIIQLLLAALL